MSDLPGVLIQFLFCTNCALGLVVEYVNERSTIVLKCAFRTDSGEETTWTGPPDDKLFTRGTRVNLKLPFSDRLNVIGDTMNGEYNLQISNIQQRDEGGYRCLGKSNGAERVHMIEVIVKASPSSDPLITQIPSGQLIVKDTVTLTCTVSGGKPIATISWQCADKTNEQNLSNSTEAVSSIQLIISKSENNKICECIAKHPLWSPDRTANILLDVAYAPDDDPTIQQTPPGGIISGTDVTLTCKVSGGNPLVILTWNCTGSFTNTTTGTTVSYSVRFPVYRNFNNKICTCSAIHPVSSYRPNVHTQIIVYYAPDSKPTIQQTKPGHIISGEKVTLICTVSGGNPLVSLSWNCTGVNTNNTTGTTVSYGVTFPVDKTFDKKICSCSATHPVSTYRPIVHHILDVYYEPETNLSIQQLPVGGIIDTMSVTLTCRVSGGNPLATLSWNCSGSTLNTITGTTVSYSVEFTVNKTYNKRICSCSATHPVPLYRPTAQHSLVVFYVPEKNPNVRQMPAGGIVNGNALTLSCSVDGGNPLPVLSWNCTGDIMNSTSDITANYSLKLTVEKSDNGKVCRCTAIHMIASYRPSVQHTLVVYYPPDNMPTVTQDPSGGIVVGGKSTLTCKVSGGNPLVTLFWNCTGTDKNTTTGNTASYSVELSVIKSDNRKICTCSTSHPDTSYNHTVQRELIVYFGPDKAKLIADPSMPWFEGNKTRLMCSYEEGNPAATIQWKRENFVTSGYNKSIFHLGEVGQNDDNLSMTCVVSNDYGTNESDALYFNIEYFPKIQLEKPNMLTEEGHNITVTCKAIGNPSPNVSWFFGENVEMTKPTKGKSELSLVDIDRQDDGKYTCKASSISQTYGQLVSVNDTRIVVNFPPDVFVNKNSTSTSEHTDLTLTCNANGKPHMYTYEWQHKFGEQYIRTLPSTSATLILTNMSYQDIGRYVCFVNNGIKDRKGILNQANHTTIELQFTPVFVRYDEVTTGKIGNNITSAVEFISFPDIKSPVQWRNETQNAVLVSNENISITIENRSVKANLHGTSVSFDKFGYRSSIHLFNFNENQDGFYNLLVNNSVGVNDLTIRIVLSDRPKPPTNFYASVIGSTVATFTWTGGFNGGNNQTFIITYWKEHSVIKNYAMIPEDNEKDYVLEISKLMPSTTYIFSINATNDEGYSEYVNNTIIVSTKDVPESAASIVGPVGGAIGGFVAAAIIIIAIIVFVRKHQVASTQKTDRKNLTFTSTEEDEDVGLKDNVLYESAGEQFKTTPGSSGDVYAIVQKSRNEQTSNGLIQETALYAEIKKKASQSNAGDVHVLTGTNRPEKTTKKGKFKEQKKRHDDVYENITEQKTTNTPKIKNKDGLVYADLVFKNDGKRNFIIRGIENKTDYADIDLDLKADPLPSDESDKDEDSTKNEEK